MYMGVAGNNVSVRVWELFGMNKLFLEYSKFVGTSLKKNVNMYVIL